MPPMATRYRLKDGKIEKENGQPDNWFPAPDGAAIILRSIPGDLWELMGTRRLRGVAWKTSGKGYGYTTLHGDQIRVELETGETLGGKTLIGLWNDCPSLMVSPLPLESREDCAEWVRRGFHLGKPPAYWRRTLGWRGAGSKQAAQALWDRFRKVQLGCALGDCPGISFPAAEEPPEWRREMEVMRETIAGLQARIESLETLARFEV